MIAVPTALIDFAEKRRVYGHSLRKRGVSFETVESPDASVVIPAHNQLEYTLSCLASIARHRQKATLEVIVVDDASDLPVFHTLNAVPGLRVVRNFRNLGFVLGCNRGCAQARGRYIVLLNNDTEVTPGWLDALLEVFQNRPDAGLVGAKLVYPDGTLQEAGGICWSDGTAWNFGRNADPARPEFNYVRETDYCSAACIALPAGLWHRLGGFDEAYAPAYYEDTDLAFRVREAGFKVYYQPQAVVVHFEGRSNGTDVSTGLKRHQVINHERFLKRWAGTLAAHAPSGVDVFRARERSLDRKIILFIDHYVPHFDRDAGSRSIMCYLLLLLKAGFSVKFVGDNFYPHQPYTDHLRQLGIEVIVGAWHAENWEQWISEIGPHLDYVFLSRAVTSLRWIPPLRQYCTAPLLFYGHDLLSRTLQRAHADLAHERFLEEAEFYRCAEETVHSQVNWIFYPSADEVAALSSASPDLQVRQIPLLTFGPPASDVPGFAARRGLLFVGGFGHPPNIDAVGWFMRECWPILLQAEPSLTLTIVGSRAPEEILKLGNDRVRVLADVSDAELALCYRESRLAIVPLRYGGGIKGKILEAMSFGTPVVATPLASEGLRWNRVHMRIADQHEFADAVLHLYRDIASWSECQLGAWRFLAERFSDNALRAALAPAVPELAASYPAVAGIDPQPDPSASESLLARPATGSSESVIDPCLPSPR